MSHYPAEKRTFRSRLTTLPASSGRSRPTVRERSPLSSVTQLGWASVAPYLWWCSGSSVRHVFRLSVVKRVGAVQVSNTIRRYEGVDTTRTTELTGKINEKLVPELRKLPGFAGYYLIEADNGVMSSLGLFETAAQADESTKFVSQWIRDEHFDTALPNAPKITTGKIVAQSNGVVAVA